MTRTIECASIIIGKVNLGIANGEQRTVEFKEKGGIGYAMIDEDEAKVLLGAIGEPEYWKPTGYVIDTEDAGAVTAAELVKQIKAAETVEAVNALLPEGEERKTVLAAAEERKTALAGQ